MGPISCRGTLCPVILSCQYQLCSLLWIRMIISISPSTPSDSIPLVYAYALPSLSVVCLQRPLRFAPLDLGADCPPFLMSRWVRLRPRQATADNLGPRKRERDPPFLCLKGCLCRPPATPCALFETRIFTGRLIFRVPEKPDYPNMYSPFVFGWPVDRFFPPPKRYVLSFSERAVQGSVQGRIAGSV